MTSKYIKQSLVAASVITIVANALGRLFGFFREAAIADLFGTSQVFDTFLLAFTIPELISFIVFAALPTAIVSQRHNGVEHSPDWESQLFWKGLGWFAVVLGGMSISIWFFRADILAWLAPELNQQQQLQGTRLVTVLAPFVLFRGLEAYFRGWLFKKKHFLVPAVTPFLLNVAVLIMLFALYDRMNIEALALGWLAGALLLFLFNGALVLRVLTPNKVSRLSSMPIRPLLQLAGAVAIVEAISFIYPAVDRYLAARYLGEGQIAALRYSLFLSQVPPGVLIVTFTTASFPWIADFSKEEELHRLKELYSKSVGLIIFVMLPVVVGLIIFSHDIVQLAFLRGAFDEQSLRLTVEPFVCYSAGLLFYSLYVYQMRYYYARQLMFRLAIILLVMLSVKILASVLLVDSFQQNGLASATSIAWLVGFIIVTVDLTRFVGRPEGTSTFITLARIGIPGVIITSFWVLAKCYWPGDNSDATIVILPRLILLGISGILLYLAVSWIFRIPEFKAMIGFLATRLGLSGRLR